MGCVRHVTLEAGENGAWRPQLEVMPRWGNSGRPLTEGFGPGDRLPSRKPEKPIWANFIRKGVRLTSLR